MAPAKIIIILFIYMLRNLCSIPPNDFVLQQTEYLLFVKQVILEK
jgi:hypothetical protein